MSDLLSLGAAGLRAYAAGLATTGDNIANAQTQGYARRGVMLAENQPLRPQPLYKGQVTPGGGYVQGVARSVDTWLIDSSRIEGGDAAFASARLRWSNAAEAALGDPKTDTGAAMTALFNTADLLSADPLNTQHRAAFLRNAEDIASTFNRTSDGLQRVQDGIGADARDAVDRLNGDIAALSSVNNGLRRAREGSTAQATLLDERDRLLDRIADATKVSVAFDAKGAVRLSLDPAGHRLLDGNTLNRIAVTAAADGRLSYAVAGLANGGFESPTGALGGLADIANDTADKLSALDRIAIDFAEGVNAAHRSGTDANGQAGQALFDTAGGSARTLRAVIADPQAVAAASPTSPSGNLLDFAALRGPSGGEASWTAFAGEQAQNCAADQARDGAASLRKDAADIARADVSAVDLDREAAELLRFQQAYQGAARVLQVARETMQSILSI